MDELTKAELAGIRDEDERQKRHIQLLEDMSKVIRGGTVHTRPCERHGADAPGT